MSDVLGRDEVLPTLPIVRMGWEKVEAARVALGIDGATLERQADFDAPAFSHRALDLE